MSCNHPENKSLVTFVIKTKLVNKMVTRSTINGQKETQSYVIFASPHFICHFHIRFIIYQFTCTYLLKNQPFSPLIVLLYMQPDFSYSSMCVDITILSRTMHKAHGRFWRNCDPCGVTHAVLLSEMIGRLDSHTLLQSMACLMHDPLSCRISQNLFPK